jgi:hypothetical protein
MIPCSLAIFAATAAPAQLALSLQSPPAAVGRYGRADFEIGVPDLAGNPYDPRDIDVHLEISTPGGATVRLPAFIYQPFERRQVEGQGPMRNWLYPTGEAKWCARFAPSEVGTYTCQAVCRTPDRELRSAEAGLECVASESHGSLRVSEHQPAYLEFADGSPFLALGQNIAFVKDLSRQEALMRKLAAAGGNFVRVWACCADWGMSLEGRKSAFGRSWDWNPPLAPEPSGWDFDSPRLCVRLGAAGSVADVSPSHTVALRPETEYTLKFGARTAGDAKLLVQLDGRPFGDAVSGGETKPFEATFATATDQWWLGRLELRQEGAGTVWVRDISLRESAGGPELLWEADPNRPSLGRPHQIDSFMLDQVVEAAERLGIYLQVVLLHRDAYWSVHPALRRGGEGPDYAAGIRDAQQLLRYAVARWGYSTSIAVWEYYNETDPNSPTDRFYAELGTYLEAADIYHHPRATSAWGPNPRDWVHPKLDTINVHYYMRPVEGEPWQDEVASVVRCTRDALASQPRKPVFLGEFGLADKRWGVSPYMAKDADLVHLHNALWASALSGLASTAMPWWWDELDPMDVYRLYRPLADFVADIPLNTVALTPLRRTGPGDDPRCVGLVGPDRAYLWIADPTATWWRAGIEGQRPSVTHGKRIELEGLQAGRYAAEWWDTRTGRVGARAELTHAGGAVSLSVPDFTADIACKLVQG